MKEDLPCKRFTRGLVPRRIQVAVIKREGQGIRAGSTTGADVEEGHPLVRGPIQSMVHARAVDGSPLGSFHEIGEEGQEANGDLASPIVGDGLHSTEGDGAFRVRDPWDPHLSCFFVGHDLGFVRQRIDDFPQPLVQGDVPGQEAPPSGRKALGPVYPLDIRDERSIEVVHGDEHDGPIGRVACDRLFEQPGSHSGRIAGLSGIQDFYIRQTPVSEGRLGVRPEAFTVFHTPSEDRGVSHHRNSNHVRCFGFGQGCAEAFGVGGDSKFMRLPHADHFVIDQVRDGAPTSGRIRDIGWLQSVQTGPHFGQAEQRKGHDQPHHQAGTDGKWAGRHLRDCIRRLWFVALLWFCAAPAHAVDVTVRVAVPHGGLQSKADGAITARLRWLGEDVILPLSLGRDGVWSGTEEGPQVRALGVSLWRKDGAKPVRLSQGLEVLPKGDVTLSWTLAGSHLQQAWRMNKAQDSTQLQKEEEQKALWAAIALCLGVLFVVVLGRISLRRDDPEEEVALPAWWVEALGWLVFAVLWTWPAVLAGPEVVGRHFDSLGTVWVIDAATRLGFDLHDPFSAWPGGATYSAIDSWILFPIAWLGSDVSPAALHGWLQILGVSSSAFAISRFAVALGAKAPFHSVAGLLFMGSGLAASAMLEGHVYQILIPWLPLMALYLWKMQQADTQIHHGVLAGLFFGLSLFTSGYIGIAAGVIGLCMGIPVLVRSENRRPILLAGAIALFASLLYVYLFQSVGQPGAAHANSDTLRMGSLSLSSLGPPSTEVDRSGHSWALALSAGAFALSCLAWRMRIAGARRLLLVVLLSTLIAMGPQWAIGAFSDTQMITSPIAGLWDIPMGRYLRWSGRVLWASLLATSALSAVVITRISGRLGLSTGYAIVAMLLLEVWLMVGLPGRQSVLPGDTPSVYLTADGPVYDLVGQGINASGEVDGWTNAILCHYQTQHSHSIAEDCVTVGSESSSRRELGTWVASRLYEGDLASVVSRMRRMKFTGIAFHGDWFSSSDRMRLETALKPLKYRRETTSAEGVVMYMLDPDVLLREENEGPSVRMIGPEAGTVEWSLRVDLAVPTSMELGYIFVEVQGHPPVELKDGHGLVGTSFGDGIYAGRFTGTVTGGTMVHLYRVVDEKRFDLWSGSIMPLPLDEDMISFKTTDGKAATPFLRSLDTFTPEIRHRGGLIVGMGWAVSLLMLLILLVPVRRMDGVQHEE